MIACSIFAFSFPGQSEAHANTHTVQKGESFYKIATKYGVSSKQLQEMNDKETSVIQPGEQLKLPVVPDDYERDLLSRLVEAEAKGESYAGKVAVATVVLNRVESDLFPDSIHGVIHDGIQFSPVLNGTIKQPASAESKRAVKEALAYQGYDNESLFFYNPDKAQSDYLSEKEVTTVIGDHVFLK
nr:cell wall hydrolase [Pontibacillus sp. HN14]